MTALSNLSKGVPVKLYYGTDGKDGVRKMQNKYNTLNGLIKLTPSRKMIVASRFSIDTSLVVNQFNSELLYSWFISAASIGRCMGYLLLWTQLCSDSNYCQPAYTEDEANEMLEDILRRITLSRVTVAMSMFFESHALSISRTLQNYNRLLRAAYDVMRTAFKTRNEMLDDRSKGKITRFANVCKGLARQVAYSAPIIESGDRDQELILGFNALAEEALASENVHTEVQTV